jgi:hypothetical protein
MLIAISVRVKKLYSLFQCECFTVGVLFLVRSMSILHSYIQTLFKVFFVIFMDGVNAQIVNIWQKQYTNSF